MRITIEKSPQAASRLAARVVTELIRTKPYAVLGCATGDTPLPLYRELVRMYNEDALDFSRITTFNLDEYVGIAPDDPNSFHCFMRRHLFDHVNVSSEHIHLPDGQAPDLTLECVRYERCIRSAGGIDLQILGIGANGHVAFNEPSSSLASRTRVTLLTRATIRDNSRFFESESDVPTRAISMGIGTILESRTCILLAFGQHKSRAIARAVEGPVSSSLPASALQLHPDVRVFLDEGAASELEHTDYYRWVQEERENGPDRP